MDEAAGRVHIDDEDPSARKVVITRDDGKEDLVIEVSRRQKLLVSEGQHIEAGTPLTEGQLDPKEILRIMGRNVSQKMLVDEVQKVYRDQGVDIHAKHIEVIVRQMLRRVTVLDSGDTRLLPGRPRRTSCTTVPRTAGSWPRAARPPLAVPSSWESPRPRWPRTPAERRLLPGDHPRAHSGRNGG